MKHLIEKFRNSSLKSQGLIALCGVLAYIVSSVILENNYKLTKFQVPYFVQQTCFDANKIKGWYEYMIQENTFDIYFRTQLIDFIFIATVIFAGFTLWTFISNLHKEDNIFYKWGHKFSFALPLAGIFDILENLVSFPMIANPYHFSNYLIYSYSTFASIKFGFWIIALVWIVLSLVALALTKIFTIIKINKSHLAIVIFTVLFSNANAQSEKPKNQYSIVFGLTQPLVLKGFNTEVNYWTKRMVFDYSHGLNLHIDGSGMGEEIKNQNIDFKVKHSLGFGVGYRFTKAFNIRFEPKMHIYETYYKGDEQNKQNSISNFNTYTLGFGAYYRWLPFEKKRNILKGITVVPSLRYWQKVSTSLSNNEVTYFNKSTNKTETFKAPNIGVANSPIIVNLSIGYTF